LDICQEWRYIVSSFKVISKLITDLWAVYRYLWKDILIWNTKIFAESRYEYCVESGLISDLQRGQSHLVRSVLSRVHCQMKWNANGGSLPIHLWQQTHKSNSDEAMCKYYCVKSLATGEHTENNILGTLSVASCTYGGECIEQCSISWTWGVTSRSVCEIKGGWSSVKHNSAKIKHIMW